MTRFAAVADGTNGAATPTRTPADWSTLKAAILGKLDVAAEFAALGIEFTRPIPNGKGVRECRAVGREDAVPSAFVNVRTGVYHDSGGDKATLDLFAFALRFGQFGRWIEVIKHYAEKAGVPLDGLQPGKQGRVREAVYLYRDEAGDVVHAVFRYRLANGKKSFTQHPPDGKGSWRYGEGCMNGVRLVPYRLPELRAADPEDVVLILEGEKDCERAAAEGLTATCNAMGSGKWRPEFAPHFAGRPVAIIPDNDEAGLAHARTVAANLKGTARSVKVVALPDLAEKGDLSDWLDQGGTVEDLGRLIFAAPEWSPDAPQVAPVAGAPWGEPVLDVAVPAQPFPTHALPEPLALFISETADSLGCPVDYLGVACLAVASGAIGRSAAIRLKEGWIESPCLYAAIVGDPGAMKSPPLSVAGRPLWRIAEDLIVKHRRAVEMAADDEPPPVPERITVDDTTVEALAPLLRDNPRGLIMVRDELTAWVAGLNQYKGGKGADRQFFLSAWAGSPVVVDRKRDEGVPLHIPHPFLSVLGALTPGMLSELHEAKSRDDGFLDRLLFTLPDPVKLRWNARGIHPALADEWESAVRRMHSQPMMTGDDGRPRPFLVLLDGDPAACFGEWFNAHCEETEGADFPCHLKGAWAKLRAYCGRLALVCELLRAAYDPEDRPIPARIGLEAMSAAVVLLDYFKNHARRVRGLLRGGGADNTDARAILAWCARPGAVRASFSERDVRRNFAARFAGDNAALASALDWLKVRRCIRPVAVAPQHGRGRPASASYEVNPSLLLARESHDQET